MKSKARAILARPFGEVVAEKRKRASLSRAELAGLADLSERTIHQIESGGTRKLQARTRRKLAEALECSVEELSGSNVSS